MQEIRDAITHALEYPETSKNIIKLLLASALKRHGLQGVRQLIKEFNLT